MYLLDTNVVSELRPGKAKASGQVLAWAASVPKEVIYLSSITVLEQEQGVLALERRTPPQGGSLRAWWNGTLEGFNGRILSLGAKEALLCASLHVPNPKSYRDSMIAAIALSHGFTVVTRNVDDFKAMVEVKLLNPWEL